MRTSFEIIGIVAITVAGSLLHFAYQASGEQAWIAVFAAVDESVWEHLKLAFWPALAWSILGWIIFGRSTPTFWIGRAVALLIMPAAIAAGFYAYTAVLGHHALIFDMALFIGSIALGQIAALVIYSSPLKRKSIVPLAFTVVAFESLVFGTLTFADIAHPLFVEGPA